LQPNDPNLKQQKQWVQHIKRALSSHLLFKCIGITVFISLFFVAYFHVLNHPAYPATVIPLTYVDTLIELQPKEYILLESLMRSAGEVVTRTMLLEKVWDYNFDPQTNVIDVHISRIRAKIDKDFDVPLLKTVRGSGYILHDPDAEEPAKSNKAAS